MKTMRICLWILALGIIVLSCEKKKDELRISGFETELVKAVDAYRQGEGLNTLAHNIDVLSREAKGHAKGRANGSIGEAGVADDMLQRWHTVEDKLGVTNVSNEGYISAFIQEPINSANAAQIAAELVDFWASDSIGEIILKGDYTIQGPGEGRTSDGNTYVMHMFCKFSQ